MRDDKEVIEGTDEEGDEDVVLVNEEDKERHCNQREDHHSGCDIAEPSNRNHDSIPKKAMRIARRVTVETVDSRIEEIVKLCGSASC